MSTWCNPGLGGFVFKMSFGHGGRCLVTANTAGSLTAAPPPGNTCGIPVVLPIFTQQVEGSSIHRETMLSGGGGWWLRMR